MDLPDVLEMVTDFLAGLLSTFPTRKRIFMHFRESKGRHCLKLPLKIFHVSDMNCY